MLIRSLLFVPGNNLRMVLKAAVSATDAVILDLEDAVAPADKQTARIVSRDALKALKFTGFMTFVRSNSFESGLILHDIEAVVQQDLDAIMLPKAEDASVVCELSRELLRLERLRGVEEERIRVIPIIESAKGVLNAYSIAASSPRLLGLAFGAGDYCRDLGRNPAFVSDGQEELLFARSQVVNSAVAMGLPAFDTVFFGELSDTEGFERECRLALRLGFSGKSLIHPNQIELANRVFLPSEEEVRFAHGLVDAFERAEAAGSGAVAHEGRMIDIMSVRQARDVIRKVREAECIARGNERTIPPLSSFFARAPF